MRLYVLTGRTNCFRSKVSGVCAGRQGEEQGEGEGGGRVRRTCVGSRVGLLAQHTGI